MLCFLLLLSSPSSSPSLLFLILIPLHFCCFHSLTYFAPLYFVLFFIFSLFMPAPLSTHFLSLSYSISWIFDQLRQQEEINSHPFIIHTFSSSPAICPSTTSDPASKSNCPSATTWTNRHTAHKHEVCVSLSQPDVNSLLFSPMFSPSLPPSASWINSSSSPLSPFY